MNDAKKGGFNNKECYALLIANLTKVSYNQSKVEEALKTWNCSSQTNASDTNLCPSSKTNGNCQKPYICCRCDALLQTENYALDWNGSNLTHEKYNALLTRSAAR